MIENINKLSLDKKIKILKDNGFEVIIQHNRILNSDGSIKSKGGETIAILDSEETIAKGSAVCSKQENYNKRIGAHIALGRAIKKLSNKVNQLTLNI